MNLRTPLLGLALLCSCIGIAGATPTDNTATLLGGPLTVKQILVGNTGATTLELRNASGATVTCGSGGTFTISRGHPSHDLMVKSLYVSYLTSKPLSFIGFENISGTCWLKGLGNS